MRFRKLDDLRLISHRDLIRTFERWFRRCGLQLRMSEGFHPKAKMSFPSALALGIAGEREVMEFELAGPADIEDLQSRLTAQAPPGLKVVELQMLSAGQPKAQVRRMTYQIPIPAPRHEVLRERISQLRSETSFLIQRDDSGRQIDLNAGTDHLAMHDGNLRFRLFADRSGSVRPREVLQALGVADLEHEGYYLTRTDVEIVA
jgi:radical SAM-linked protein